MSKRHRRHGKRRRDFWRSWREEQQRIWAEQQGSETDARTPPSFSRRTRARHWREFFHNFTGTWPEEHWALRGRRFNPWHQGQDEFNPFVANILSKGGGLLPLYVLHLLQQQPRYGNDLMEEISSRTGGRWVTNPGAIYPLLTMMEQQGLVEGEWKDPRKRTTRVYHLTAAGAEELERLRAIVHPKLQEAITVLQTVAADLGADEPAKPSNYL